MAVILFLKCGYNRYKPDTDTVPNKRTKRANILLLGRLSLLPRLGQTREFLA
jgi:hypothetical protein